MSVCAVLCDFDNMIGIPSCKIAASPRPYDWLVLRRAARITEQNDVRAYGRVGRIR